MKPRLAGLAGLLFTVAACSNGADQEAVTTTTVDSTATLPTTTAITTTTTTTTPLGGLPPGDDATVRRVIDGDTIELADPAGTRIRLIGVDTPERGACFSSEATAHTSSLLPVDQRVRLAYDVERRDRYGRTLAYVYRLTDGLFVNLGIARDGFAMQLTVAPNVSHAEEFARAVGEARSARRGLWGGCQTTAASRTSTTTTTGGGTNCSPAYPDVCIPPPPPDLDCSQISHRRFRVLAPDPHGFDGNENNRMGCESG